MRFKQIIKFTGRLLLLLGVLASIKHLSGILEKDTLRTYRDVEELKKNFDDILIPSYIPEFLVWPPSKIIGQKRPYRAVAIELKDKKAKITLVLIVTEREEFRLESLSMKETKEQITHIIKGRKATLKIGRCSSIYSVNPEDLTCSELTWKERRYIINITIRSGPFELLKIAESMIH